MPPRRRSVTPHQLPLTFGAPSRRSSWASAELPDARVYGGAPVEPFPLTAGLVDGFRQEFSRGVEAVLDAADIGAARRASEHMKRLGAAWRTFTVTWLAPGLEEALGYARARSVRTKLTVPAWTWEAPFHPMLSDVQAFAVFVRDRQAWAREAIKATTQPFDALNTLATAHRITLYRPRVQRASIGRLSIGIAPMPDEIARAALGRVGEALRALDEQRRVPWLPARLPPITLVNECLYVGGIRFNGGYDPRLRTVDICASWAATEESVREIAMTIAHESGHHIWRTVLSGDAQAEWTDAINRPVMVRAADIAAAWRPGESADAFIERVSETDPVMALRLGGEMSFGTLAGWERGHFAAMGPKAVVRLSANPVTIYGAKSPEEAFCEALGLLAAYGPRTVLPEVAAILQTIVPTVRPKSNDLIEHMALHTGIETVMEAEERDEHEAHARHLRQRRRRHKRNAAPTAAGYEPDPDAPALGEWDRSGKEPRWRQGHESLVRDGLRSWKGDPITMRLHIADEREREPEPGSGTGKILRAQARALLWELAHHARPSPVALHRGSHIEPNGIQSWSEKRRIASSWASRNGGRVFTLPKGTRGLRVLDYTSSAFDSEAEWVVDTLTKANGHQRRHKSNSARAAREMMREEPYTETTDWGETRTRTRREEYTVPAHVTPDHWTDPATLAAIAAARNTQQGYNKRLGAGNFGIGYRADTPDGPRLVKIPAAHNIHEQPWTREQQTHNILHEAGVANELAALGYSVIPRGVYAEWGGGSPAFVRELGEPVTSLSPAEYGEVERQLLSIERDHGWRVVDELQMYRRPDGSVFVGDVGIWWAPSYRTKRWTLSGSGGSSLDRLLKTLQQQTLPGLAVQPPSGRPRSPEYAYLDRVPVMTLATLAEYEERLSESLGKLRETPDFYTRKGGGLWRSMDARYAQSVLQGVAEREAMGIPTPDDVRSVVPAAREVLRFTGDPDPDDDD